MFVKSMPAPLLMRGGAAESQSRTQFEALLCARGGRIFDRLRSRQWQRCGLQWSSGGRSSNRERINAGIFFGGRIFNGGMFARRISSPSILFTGGSLSEGSLLQVYIYWGISDRRFSVGRIFVLNRSLRDFLWMDLYWISFEAIFTERISSEELFCWEGLC